MLDLIWAYSVLLFVTIACYLVARCTASRLRGPVYYGVVLVVSAVLLVFAFQGYGWIGFVRVFPHSSAIVLSNMFPPILVIFMALVAEHPTESIGHKRAAITLLVAVAFITSLLPLLRAKPITRNDRIVDGVVMQSTTSTCGPAAAATLLREHEIPASEREMTDLCLTGTAGTWPLGIYRGLALKTHDTPYRVEVLDGDVDALRVNRHWPAVVLCRLPKNAHDDRLINDGGWTPGVQHATVLYGIDEHGRALVGDPSRGGEVWPPGDLEKLYEGIGFALAPRE